MSEIVAHQGQHTTQEVSLQDQMNYAQAIANSPLLPQAYQGKPASALIAIGLGQAMGLTPAEALYRIDVIQGKPAASAELIASNVRKAGHKLRIHIDEKAVSVTATIIRADDPDHPISITRDMQWAKDMGLASKENYRKQPLTMLQWRAITAVARLGASEALYGVQYTADELYDFPSKRDTPQRQGGYGIAANMPTPAPAPAPRPEDVVSVTHEDETPEAPVLVFASRSQQSRLGKAFDAIGVEDNTKKAEEVQRWAKEQGIDREVKKSGDLTVDEMENLISELEALAAGQPATEWETAEVPS